MSNHQPYLPYPEALARLSELGTQFPDEAQDLSPVGEGVQHQGRRGVKDTAIDVAALAATANIYTGDSAVAQALEQSHDVPVNGRWRAARTLARHLLRDGLIMGFSGYASGGFPYREEVSGMVTLFEHLQAKGAVPELAVDGGTRMGMPGISSLMAREYGSVTLGVVPRQGMDEIAPHNHLIFKGSRYGDETDLIGTIPDVLVVGGGGPNSQKEYLAALASGARVLLLRLKDYPETSLAHSYTDLPETERALKTGQLVVCNSIDAIPESLDRVLTTVRRRRRVARSLHIVRALRNQPQ